VAAEPTSRLSRRRLLLLAALTVVIVGSALVSSFPARAILQQQRDTAARQAEFERVQTEVRRLDAHLARLRDPDVIAQLSREKYGYVPPGWESYHLVTPEIGDVRLPDGWPFLLGSG
jgi:cell division protein FtsB